MNHLVNQRLNRRFETERRQISIRQFPLCRAFAGIWKSSSQGVGVIEPCRRGFVSIQLGSQFTWLYRCWCSSATVFAEVYPGSGTKSEEGL